MPSRADSLSGMHSFYFCKLPPTLPYVISAARIKSAFINHINDRIRRGGSIREAIAMSSAQLKAARQGVDGRHGGRP